MKRVLFVTPHFPPDASAGAHRARVLAPHLERAGWRPTVLTVEPEAYGGVLDHELAAMLPPDLDVVRASAWRPATSRRVGFGDLGLRSLTGLWRAARALTASTHFDAVYLTTYPVYPALLGDRLRRRTGAPLVIDLQDPWTGAWGLSVGGGPDGGPDLRSRVSRRIMKMIEERVIPGCDAMTGVSTALLQELQERYPALRERPSLVLPIGIDPHDLDWVRTHQKPATAFDPEDGHFHVCSVGTLLPLAIAPLRALFSAIAAMRSHDARRTERLRLHFIGTSNQADECAAPRIMPIAEELGVADLVTEHPARIPFADALRLQLAASALLVLGSTEARYTASKVAPVLATGRPVLAIAHADSDIAHLMGRASRGIPGIRVAEFREASGEAIGCIRMALDAWLTHPPASHDAAVWVGDLTGPALARDLGHLLDSLTKDARA